MLSLTWKRVQFGRTAQDQWTQVGIVRQIAAVSIPGVLVSGVVVLVMQVASSWLGSLPASAPAQDLLAHLKSSPGPSYDTLLTTVATISGVVLGLYYGAVATLIGSRYGRVPAEIRSLVSIDPIGTTYGLLLASAMGVSLLLLALEASGSSPTRLHAYGALVVSLIALYGFFALGRRVFDFMDPTRLIVPVLPDFLVAAKGATTRGYRFETAEYQALYRRQASYQLDLLDMLFDVAKPAESGSGKRLLELARYIPPVLQEYLKLKPAIPGASHWYPRTARQRRWYLSDYTVQELAIATRTALQVDEGVETNWVEQRLLAIVETQITTAVTQGNWELVGELLQTLGRCNRAMGRGWMTAFAQEVTDRVQAAILPRLPLVAPDVDLRFQIAVVTDLLALARLELLLGFGERVRGLALVDVAAAVGRIDWTERRSIYEFPLGFALADGLELLRSQLGFERDIYGHEITPSWYLAEECARQLLAALKSAIEPILAESERPLPTVPGDDTSIERAQVLGTFASRKAEYASKLGYLIEVVNDLAAKLTALNRSRDREWVEWKADEITTRLSAAWNARMREFASLIPALARVPPGTDRVDHFGQAVSLAGEECLRALIADDHAYFQALYPLYLAGCLAAAEQIARERERWSDDTFMALYGEALLDLMDISGYTLLFAELRRDHQSWVYVKKLWSKFLAGTDGERRREALLATYEYHRSLLGVITPRSIIRTSWQQRVDRVLETVPRRQVVVRHVVPVERPIHPSPLVRAMTPRMMMGSHYKGEDIFVSCHLRRGRPRPERDDLHDAIVFARRNPEEDE